MRGTVFFVFVVLFVPGLTLYSQEYDPWKQHAERRIKNNPDALFEKYLDSARTTGDFARKVDYMNRAIAFAKNAGLEKDFVTGNYFLAKIYFDNGDTKYARAHFDKAIGLIEKQDADNPLLAPKFEGKIYYDAGSNCSYKSDHPEALHYFKLCEKIAKENYLDSLLTISQRQIGNVYYYLGEIAKSTEYYYKSLEKARDLEMPQAIASALSNIGGNLDKMGRTDEAEEMYQKGLNIAQENKIPELVATISNNIGVLAFNKEEYDKAIDHYNIALSYAVKNNNVLGDLSNY